jgi:hypothetical protein
MWNIISSAHTLASLLWGFFGWLKKVNWKTAPKDFSNWLRKNMKWVIAFIVFLAFVEWILTI